MLVEKSTCIYFLGKSHLIAWEIRGKFRCKFYIDFVYIYLKYILWSEKIRVLPVTCELQCAPDSAKGASAH